MPVGETHQLGGEMMRWETVEPQVEQEDVGGGAHRLRGEDHDQHQDVPENSHSQDNADDNDVYDDLDDID